MCTSDIPPSSVFIAGSLWTAFCTTACGLVAWTFATASLTNSGFPFTAPLCAALIGDGDPFSSLLWMFSFSFGWSLFASLSFNNSFNNPMFAFVEWKSSALTFGASLYSMSISLFAYSDFCATCILSWYSSVGSPGFLTTIFEALMPKRSDRYSFITPELAG